MKVNEDKQQKIIILAIIFGILTLLTLLFGMNKNSHTPTVESEKEVAKVISTPTIDTIVPPTPVRETSALHPFDPNTVTYAQLRKIGLSKENAISLIRYRAAGKIYRIPEDLATIHGMKDSTYFAIEPYIIIAEKYQYKPTKYTQPTPSPTPSKAVAHRVSHSSTPPLTTTSAPAPPPAPTPRFNRVNLNTADSTALDALYGIGAISAQAIIQYRKMLGGYHSTEQLLELKVVLEKNYERFLPYIFIKDEDISKIDVNFAPASDFISHPYISRQALRRLMNVRQMKGGWRNLEEMIDDNIFKQEDATRLQPYLFFDSLGVWNKQR